MSKFKPILAIASILILTISTLFFIIVNNDHEECSEEVTITINQSGEEVKVTKHICKEKYSF